MPINVAPLCICLPTRGETTRIDRHIDDASLSLRGQRSRVLGERLHWDVASVVHFIEPLSLCNNQVVLSEQVGVLRSRSAMLSEQV
ncbi:hypothetical protein VN97_g11945 [Penicillium thymicola]|uniref:Uncharacterized protein n=1 Tax=Penicillium thymicola TaxID=293382 RepID=A0AAI9X2G4_PENTH|nr:hypothetical protein VN97_g11945 [Penicillium thymicola]